MSNICNNGTHGTVFEGKLIDDTDDKDKDDIDVKDVDADIYDLHDVHSCCHNIKKIDNIAFTVFVDISIRVAKCHGYGGYIRVKKLEVSGKKFERIHSFAKSSIVWGKF